MMKYMDNIDRDHSMSLDQSEFAWHYAAMTHTSAEAVFALLDENKDGKLTGKSLIRIIVTGLDYQSKTQLPVKDSNAF